MKWKSAYLFSTLEWKKNYKKWQCCKKYCGGWIGVKSTRKKNVERQNGFMHQIMLSLIVKQFEFWLFNFCSLEVKEVEWDYDLN